MERAKLHPAGVKERQGTRPKAAHSQASNAINFVTTTKQNKSVGAKQRVGGSVSRPPWHRLRDAIADIERGVYPQKAFDRHNLPQSWRDDHRISQRIRIAEANLQTAIVSTVFDSATGTGTQVVEGNWIDANDPEAPPTATVGSRAPSRVRAWSKRDPKSATWLLERRFPSEYGSQQPAQVAETVVTVLGALAALRQQPASLENLRYRLELPAKTADPTDLSEGTGTPTGTP